MNANFQRAAEPDIPQLLALMREFYTLEGMDYDEDVARRGLVALLAPGAGGAYLIVAGGQVAGYMVLTFCFSLEFRGGFGLLDELYVRESFRKRGIGKAAIEYADTVCRARGFQYLRLEVNKQNKAAQALYDFMGFKREQRYLYTKRI
jgi:ribosomal protein S18 acetylase RimI-like enzyme